MPMAKKEKVTCPECGSTRIIKKGRRKNKKTCYNENS